MKRIRIFALLLTVATAPAQIQFRHHFVDDNGPAGEAWGSLVLADWDRDGGVDIITSKTKHGKGDRRAVWYRNQGALTNWSGPMVLRKGFTTGCGSVAFDANGDGWIDYFGGTLVINPAADHLDKAGSSPDWSFGNRIHDLELGDFDRDGTPEIVANVQHSDAPGLYLMRPGADVSKPWGQERIFAVGMHRPSRRNFGAVHAAISPKGIADIDGDGDQDIVYLGAWCENADGKGTKWTAHENIPFRPTGPFACAVRCWVADIDQDGANDIVQSVCDAPKAKVVWMRNTKGDGSEWEIHELPNEGRPGDFHSLVVGDLDLDGDLDVYVDEMEHLHLVGRPPEMIVWENLDGKGSTWAKRVVRRGLGGHQAQAADLDGDGDLDIVTRPYTAKGNSNQGRMHISLLENLAK